MNFFATPLRRRILFGCLYLSEGAPIGFIWLALSTRLRASGVPVEQITWLRAVPVLPWTFKFVWAPLISLPLVAVLRPEQMADKPDSRAVE